MLLAILLILPLIGAIAIVASPAKHAKWIALFITTATFLYSISLAMSFENWTDGQFGFATEKPFQWFEQFGITLSVGVDSVSLLLVMLSTLLMPLCVWGSFTAITDRVKEYYGWMLAIQAAMVGVFIARDLIFFYVCFEFTLIPMYFLIAIWGGENRAKACIKFFLFTFTGSMIALAGLLYVAWQHAISPLPDLGVWTFDIAQLTTFASTELSASQQAWVLLALISGFAVKVPLFPVHTWLPLAHAEAPTAGSVLLASILLKLGTYGLYRFILPMVPEGLLYEVTLPLVGWTFIPLQLIAVLAVISIIYAALICWVQDDIKRLVAYSSVSHLGFCVLGLVALNPLGLQGSVLYMLNHGLSTGALFFLVGMIYERYHTRDMDKLSGLSKSMPVWAFFMVFFVLASVGLPGLNGFIGEFLCLIGTFVATADNTANPGILGPWYAAFAAFGMILTAMYLLMMVGKVVFGALKEPTVSHDSHHKQLPKDLSFREICVLAPIAVLCLYIGLQPKPLTDAIQAPVDQILAQYPPIVKRYHASQSRPDDFVLIQQPTEPGGAN